MIEAVGKQRWPYGPASKAQRSGIKASFLMIFVVAAIVIVRFTPLREQVSTEELGALLETAGPGAPAASIGAYAGGI